MDEVRIEKDCVKTLLDTKFIKVYDLQYAPGKHYFDATRRTPERLIATKSKEEFQNLTADAVSCFVIIEETGSEPKLLLTSEYRYPAGQYLLSVPAGLIDPEDEAAPVPALSAAAREIFEETGIRIGQEDSLTLVNPAAFSSPGMTDECNALVCAVIRHAEKQHLTQDGAVGSEKFNGFIPVTAADCRELIKTGRDREGNFYSVYTMIAMLYFLSGMWKA